ncbi:MAG: hypothetical protein HC828_06785, partial [Blastochloris sp.]|nr:hypothetical protein [Blastochloris sp.]
WIGNNWLPPCTRGWIARRYAMNDKVLARIAAAYGLTTTDLMGQSRTKAVVAVRHLALWILHRRYGPSLTELGSFFGGRDHSTIHHALAKVNQQRAADPVYALEVETLYAQVCPPIPTMPSRTGQSPTTLADHVAWVLHVGRTQLGLLPPRRDPLQRREWLKREVG